MDWIALEDELTDELVKQVREMMAEHPGLEFTAVTAAPLYYETEGVISLPPLGFNTDGELSDLAGDWEFFPVDWLGPQRQSHVVRVLEEEACRAGVEHWHVTFQLFLSMLIRVCQRSRRELDGMPVYIHDPEAANYEFLLRSTLTADEVAEHFPELDEAQEERARVAALPRAEQIAFHLAVLDDIEHPIGFEEAEKALREIGSDAIPGLLALLPRHDAAKLLADIGAGDEAVVAALSRLYPERS